MASDCNAPKRGTQRRCSSCCIFVFALVGWTVFGILFVALSPVRPPAPPPRIPAATLDLPSQTPSNKHPRKDPVDANRRFLTKLLSDEVQRERTGGEDIWNAALVDGVPVVASQSMALLLQTIRPPAVKLAPCDSDITLDPLPRDMKRIFIASNQHQSEDILPNLIRQVLEFILDNPQVQFFVSVYESGSVDRTPYLLLLFQRVLDHIGVGNMIEYNGDLNRKEGQERIDFLAEVRNAALKPLTDHAKNGFHYDRMIFINDVFFCKEDMHRLLLHHGDLNCGMDFVHHTLFGPMIRFDPNQIEEVKRLYYKERIKDDAEVIKAAETPAAWRRWDSKRRTEPYRYISTDPDTWMDFYDIWVSHDAAGRHFVNVPPYVRNNSYEHTRLKEGLPFPAECCWNGVAVLNPEPFTKHQLLFRAASEDECQTSECVLMCHDFQRLGYRKVTVDPGVWTTYEYQDARLLALVGVRGMHKVPWKTVRDAPPMKDIHVQPGQLVDCCPLQPGKEIVDFDECLSNYSIWNVSSALERFGLKAEELLSTASSDSETVL